MEISVLIVNYNTKELTLNCIRSIYQYTHNLEFEVIVIDNDSHDGSREAILEAFTCVKVINSGSNLGFGRANNLGAKHAVGRYLFFLNSDTVLIENSLKILLNHYQEIEKNHKTGIIGAILVDSTNNVTSSGGGLPNVWSHILLNIKKLFGFLSSNSVFDSNIQLHPVGMVSGADMLIKKAVFDSVDGFDDNIFLYYEDTDLNKRLTDLGYCHFIDTTTKIIHFEGGSAKMSHWKRSVIHESQNYFFKKYSNKLTYTVYLIYQIAFSLYSLKNKDFSFRDNIDFLKKNLKALINAEMK